MTVEEMIEIIKRSGLLFSDEIIEALRAGRYNNAQLRSLKGCEGWCANDDAALEAWDAAVKGEEE